MSSCKCRFTTIIEPFKVTLGPTKEVEFEPGQCLGTLLLNILTQPEVYRLSSVWLNGAEIPKDKFKQHQVRKNDHVTVHLYPANAPSGEVSKQTYRLLASVGSQLAGILAPGALGLSGVGAWAVRAGITLLGIWAVDSLIPLPEESEQNNVNFGGTGNGFRAGSRVPKVYGKHLMVPPMAARPYTLVQNGELYLKAVFCLGYQPVKTHRDTLRIGDNPISFFKNAKTRIVDGYTSFNNGLSLYSNEESIVEQRYNDRIRYHNGEGSAWGTLEGSDFYYHEEILVYVTEDDTIEFSFDVTFPNGLYADTANGNNTLHIVAEYQQEGGWNEHPWNPILPREYLLFENTQASQLNNTSMFAWIDDMAAKVEASLYAYLGIPQDDWAIQAQLYDELDRFVVSLKELGTAGASQDGLSAGQIASMNAVYEIGEDLESRQHPTQRVFPSSSSFLHIVAQMIGQLRTLEAVLKIQAMVYNGETARTIEQSVEFEHLIHYQNAHPDVFDVAGGHEIVFSGSSTDPKRFTVKANVPKGKYRVRIRKSQPPVYSNAEEETLDSSFQEEAYVTAFRSIRESKAISQEAVENLAFLEMEMPITDTINGSLNELSLVVETPVRFSEDGITWEDYNIVNSSGEPVSRNPAWQYVDVLCGDSNRQPLELTEIDLPTIYEWATYCEENKLYFDKVVENDNTVRNLLNRICAAGKASPNYVDGKFSVAIDKPKDTLDLVISPSNSHGFSAVKSMQEIPHALRVYFVNPRKDWEQDHILVYKDGYGPGGAIVPTVVRVTANDSQELVLDFEVHELVKIYDNVNDSYVTLSDVSRSASNGRTTYTLSSPGFDKGYAQYSVYVRSMAKRPEIIEDVTIDGIVDVPENTSHEYYTGHAFHMGKYLLRSMVHRPEIFTVEMDHESLTALRGDKVTLMHDIVQWGLGSGRVTSVSTDTSGDVTDITVNADILQAAGTYSIKVRKENNSLWGPYDVTYSGSGATFSLVTPQAPGTPALQWGDLILWGTTSTVSIDCIIKEIHPRRMNEQQLTLVEAAEQVHDVDAEFVGQYRPNLTFQTRPGLKKPYKAAIQKVHTDERAAIRTESGTVELGILVEYVIFRDRPIDAEVRRENEVDSVEVQFKERYRTGEGEILHPKWVSVGVYPVADSVRVPNVRQSVQYDVRIRSIARNGVFSDWDTYLGITIQGTLNPPHNVSTASLRLDGTTFRWRYQAPVDFAGFKVRYGKGHVNTWDRLEDAHDGLVGNSWFEFADLPKGTYTFAVKAVDTAGNQSTLAAFLHTTRYDEQIGHPLLLVIDGPDRTSAYGLGDFNYWNSNDYSELAESGSPDWYLYQTNEGFLLSELVVWEDLSGPAFNVVDLDTYSPFKQLKAECYWETVSPSTSSYFSLYGNDFELYAAWFLDVEDNGRHWEQQRKNVNATIWPESASEDVWPEGGEKDYWPVEFEWHPYKGHTRILPDDSWEHRFWAPKFDGDSSTEYIKLTSSYFYYMTPKKSEDVVVETSTAGIITINAGDEFFGKYKKITSVTVSIYNPLGAYSASGAEVRAYSVDSISIRTFDSSGTLTQGQVLVHIEGF